MKATLEARRNTTTPEWSPVWEGDADALRVNARAMNERLGWTKYRVRTLPAEPREHDVTRLPKWAQERIARADAAEAVTCGG